jgi:hypothetical protein
MLNVRPPSTPRIKRSISLLGVLGVLGGEIFARAVVISSQNEKAWVPAFAGMSGWRAPAACCGR